MSVTSMGPRTYDPEVFDQSRYSDSSLDLWVPHLIRLERIAGEHRVLDMGCATGGFTQAVAEQTGATILGLDFSLDLLRYAWKRRAPGVRRWCQGSVEDVPFSSERFDRVLCSLVLHQVPDKPRALAEARRILRPRGRILIRTVLPELAHEWVEARYFPSYSRDQSLRLTPLAELSKMLEKAGFAHVGHEVVRRNRARSVDEVAVTLRSGSDPKFAMVPGSEIEEGVVRMREELGDGEFIDHRPHSFVFAVRVEPPALG